jgi:hypothetical protein
MKSINSPLQSQKGARKITIGFSGFGPQKPDPNRTETGRFGPVLVQFGSPFFPPVWLIFKGKNRTEQKMITPS